MPLPDHDARHKGHRVLAITVSSPHHEHRCAIKRSRQACCRSCKLVRTAADRQAHMKQLQASEDASKAGVKPACNGGLMTSGSNISPNISRDSNGCLVMVSAAASLCALKQGLRPRWASIFHLGRGADACALFFAKRFDGWLDCWMGGGTQVESTH